MRKSFTIGLAVEMFCFDTIKYGDMRTHGREFYRGLSPCMIITNSFVCCIILSFSTKLGDWPKLRILAFISVL